jgi:hypothetical protein
LFNILAASAPWPTVTVLLYTMSLFDTVISFAAEITAKSIRADALNRCHMEGWPYKTMEAERTTA